MTAPGRPSPATPAGPDDRAVAATDTRASFPVKALGPAVLGLVVGNVVGGIGYLVGAAAISATSALAIILGQIGLWTGMLGACWYAGRAYGAGSFRLDFGLRPRPADAWIGAVAAVADWIAAYGVAQLVSLLGKGYAGSNSNIVTDVRSDTAALGATIAFAVIGAPIVEELFFRGLVQRALEPLAGVVLAILIQGLLFGAVHVVETSGAGRLGLWLSLSAVGIVHGFVYQRVKRITASMVAHALFNISGVVLIFAVVAPAH